MNRLYQLQIGHEMKEMQSLAQLWSSGATAMEVDQFIIALKDPLPFSV